MPDAYRLHWKLDRPYVEQNRSEEVHVLVTIEPGPAVLAGSAPLPTHLILLVDVSASMNFLMRHDPKAQTLGEGMIEGRASQTVVSDVPSRRETACAVVRKLAERLHGDDRLSLIAFDDKPHVLAAASKPDDLERLGQAIGQLGELGGGGTALGPALQAVQQLLIAHAEPGRTRKILLLTDGEADDATLALNQAQILGRDLHVPIAAFGTGECKVAFLTEIAKVNLAGAFYHLRNETDAEQLFPQVLTGQKNVLATDAVLKLWLPPDIFMQELYRTRPEILFVGDLQPDAQNLVELRLEQMEKGKAYEFLFRCTVPRRAANQRLRLAKATLAYELPAEKRKESMETNIVVEYTADVERARQRSGDVRRVLARAEVQRQVLFLQAKIDTLTRGQGTDADRVLVAKLLRALTVKFEEFGDQAMVNQYREMEEEFRRRGTISQEMLNRSLAASSRAEEVIVAQDIDF